MVNGLLIAVGGSDGVGATNIIFSLTGKEGEQTWSKHYPPMPTKHSCSAAVCYGNSLIVAGGHTNDHTAVAVEVMDTSSLQWFTASSLLHYFNLASATVCGDTLYLMGGCDKSGADGSLSVLTCSLTALLESCNLQSLLGKMRALSTGGRPTVWRKATDVPAVFTLPRAPPSVDRCWQSVGIAKKASCMSHDCDPTDNVYMYDPSKDTWTVISHMPTPRYRCHVAVLPDNELLVVGGTQHSALQSDVVEVGSIL